MIHPFSTGHQARCSSRKRSSHVSLSSVSFAISVIMTWNTEHCAFVVETYFKWGDSVIAAQRQFRTHFGVGRHGRVSNRKTILFWIRYFRQTSSALKRKSPGLVDFAAYRHQRSSQQWDMLSPHHHNVPLLNMHSPWGYLTVMCGEVFIWTYLYNLWSGPFEGSHRRSRHWRTPFAMRLQQYHRKWLAEQYVATTAVHRSRR